MDSRIKFLEDPFKLQNWQTGANVVQNLQALAPQFEELKEEIAENEKKVQYHEEKLDFLHGAVSSLTAKLNLLEVTIKGEVQAEMGKFSAQWACTTTEIQAEFRRCEDKIRQKGEQFDGQMENLWKEMNGNFQTLSQNVWKKLAELEGFYKNSWQYQQNKWQEVEKNLAQFRIILGNVSAHLAGVEKSMVESKTLPLLEMTPGGGVYGPPGGVPWTPWGGSGRGPPVP